MHCQVETILKLPFLCFPLKSTFVVSLRLDGIPVLGYCYTGETRLVGGRSEREGRVEVCSSNSRWGTVCDNQWSPSHTRVVCRHFGYEESNSKLEVVCV